MPDGPISNDRLDTIRDEIDRDLSVVGVHVAIAQLYAGIADDAGLERALDDARDRMRSVLREAARLKQERGTAELTRQAAIEYRAQAPVRRKA